MSLRAIGKINVAQRVIKLPYIYVPILAYMYICEVFSCWNWNKSFMVIVGNLCAFSWLCRLNIDHVPGHVCEWNRKKNRFSCKIYSVYFSLIGKGFYFKIFSYVFRFQLAVHINSGLHIKVHTLLNWYGRWFSLVLWYHPQCQHLDNSVWVDRVSLHLHQSKVNCHPAQIQ